MLIPRTGVLDTAISRATLSMVPWPRETTSKSTARASAAASLLTVARKRARFAVGGSQKTLRPDARMQRAASATAAPAEALPEFPMMPTRLILSAALFNQHQEF